MLLSNLLSYVIANSIYRGVSHGVATSASTWLSFVAALPRDPCRPITQEKLICSPLHFRQSYWVTHTQLQPPSLSCQHQEFGLL